VSRNKDINTKFLDRFLRINLTQDNNMEKILIIGYGNFGKLMTSQLKDSFDIFIADKKSIENFDSNKIITAETVSSDLMKDIKAVIFAVPVQFLQEAVDEWRDKIHKHSFILDVSSVKVYPLNILKKSFSGYKIIGTHPLFGPESVAKKISDLKVVVCNISATKKDLQSLTNLINKLNYEVIEMTADEHDKQIAQVQVLSHFIGFALREFDLKSDLPLKTLAYRKLYDLYENILNDTDELFYTIQHYNPYAKKMRERFIDSLIKLNKKL